MTLFVGHLQAGDHTAVRRAMVSVMEHRDVPAPAKLAEEVEQRTRSLGELKTQHHFVHNLGRATTDHVTDVQFGQFVVGQVQHREPLFGQTGEQLAARIVFRVRLYANENVRFAAGVVAIIEFGDLALADGFAECLEAARFFRNGYGDDGFAAFTQLGALGDVAKTVEVDVGAGIDGYKKCAR